MGKIFAGCESTPKSHGSHQVHATLLNLKAWALFVASRWTGVIQTALIIDISSFLLVAIRFWFIPIPGQVLVDSERTQIIDVDDLDKMA